MKIEPSVELLCEDIRNVPINGASLVILNLTLQFIPRSERSNLISKIRRGILPGGALVLVEKTRSPDPQEQAFLTRLHHDFKRANGYSDLEISRKRTALEKVLIPETDRVHLSRLKKCGFSTAYRWFSCIGFNGYLGIVNQSPDD